MTQAGGRNGLGNIFSLAIDGTFFRNVVSFSGTGGATSGLSPSYGSLTIAGTTLYGMTQSGGSHGNGNIFSVGTDGTNFQNLVSFNSSGSNGFSPQGSLTLSDSTLFGMTYYGGSGLGTVFSVGINGTNYRNLVNFTNTSGTAAGGEPFGDLTLSGTSLFGMTSAGGAGYGTLFSVGTDGTGFGNLVVFSGTGGPASGKNPHGDLTLSGTTLYGLTLEGGTNGVQGGQAGGPYAYGNLFSVGTNAANYQSLVSFTGNSGKAIGEYPSGGLTLSGTTLYGMTQNGGTQGQGNIFSVGIDGSGYDDLYDFSGHADGVGPSSDLILTGGTLFGMAGGGANGNGTVFALTLPIPTPEPGTLALVGAICLAAFVWRRCRRRLALIAAIALLPSSIALADVFNMPAGQTSLQFVTVGDPGNVADHPANGGVFGAVPYTFNMGKYDVTLGQYVQFLNSVAATDTYGLYNQPMGQLYRTLGIRQSGSPGNYTYSVTGSAPSAANMPVFAVTWGDAARFCNWLDNGQPIGAEGLTTTESGAYYLNGATSATALMAVASTAHSGSGAAKYFIPTENEWFKAAYYVGGSSNLSFIHNFDGPEKI